MPWQSWKHIVATLRSFRMNTSLQTSMVHCRQNVSKNNSMRWRVFSQTTISMVSSNTRPLRKKSKIGGANLAFKVTRIPDLILRFPCWMAWSAASHRSADTFCKTFNLKAALWSPWFYNSLTMFRSSDGLERLWCPKAAWICLHWWLMIWLDLILSAETTRMRTLGGRSLKLEGFSECFPCSSLIRMMKLC